MLYRVASSVNHLWNVRPGETTGATGPGRPVVRAEACLEHAHAPTDRAGPPHGRLRRDLDVPPSRAGRAGAGRVSPVEPPEFRRLVFTAPCPRGHLDAGWTAELVTVVGETSDDYLGAQQPRYVVRCPRCDDEDRSDRP